MLFLILFVANHQYRGKILFVIGHFEWLKIGIIFGRRKKQNKIKKEKTKPYKPWCSTLSSSTFPCVCCRHVFSKCQCFVLYVCIRGLSVFWYNPVSGISILPETQDCSISLTYTVFYPHCCSDVTNNVCVVFGCKRIFAWLVPTWSAQRKWCRPENIYFHIVSLIK